MAKKFKIVQKPKKPKMSFNERVRKVIKGEAETKEKVVNIFNKTPIIGSGLDSGVGGGLQGATQANLLDTLAIAQGTNEEEREGNRIEDCRLRIRGVIASLPSSATNQNYSPYEVHMIAYKLKKDIANSPSSIKVLPNNNTGPVDGTLINTMYPYNKDRYIMRKIKTFRLRPLYQAFTPGTTADIVNPQSSNAPMFHRFVETLDIHKDLKYNDGTTVPANDWIGISFYVINADGSVEAEGNNRAEITMDATLRYKDL